jgi:hypothetical protein
MCFSFHASHILLTAVLQTPNFSAFRPRDIKIASPHVMSHVAWNCDGKKLAAVGIDKNTRIWQPEKSVCRLQLQTESVLHFSLRWSSGQLLYSLVVTLTMSITFPGTQHTQTYFVLLVRKTGRSCSGTRDVSSSKTLCRVLHL